MKTDFHPPFYVRAEHLHTQTFWYSVSARNGWPDEIPPSLGGFRREPIEKLAARLNQNIGALSAAIIFGRDDSNG